MIMKEIRLLNILLIAALMFALIPSHPVKAATTWVVTKVEDTDDQRCDTDCSLREALSVVQDGDTITFRQQLNGLQIVLTSMLEVRRSIIIDASALPKKIRISGDNLYQVFHVMDGTVVTFTNLRIENGFALVNKEGSGMFIEGADVTLNKVLFTNNVAKSHNNRGGAISFLTTANYAKLTIEQCEFINNYSDGAGAAIYGIGKLNINNSTFSGNETETGDGGAIFIHNMLPGLITNTTFVENRGSTWGGGITLNYGEMTIENSTFDDNFAISGGSQIYVNESAILNLYNSTLANGFRGGVFNDHGKTHIYNSIIVGKEGNEFSCENFAGQEFTLKNTIIDAYSNCGLPNGSEDPLPADNLLLGGLNDNGGATQTIALLDDSPAIDAGDPGTCLATDQRGITRPLDGNGDGTATCDIGAFEYREISSLVQKSEGRYDGFVVEASEDSGVGYRYFDQLEYISVGDDKQNRQLRGFLHFDTSSIPDNAVIVSATIQLQTQDILGPDPMASLGDFLVDIKSGAFSDLADLQNNDFESFDSNHMQPVGIVEHDEHDKYQAELSSRAFPYINLTGTTQLRLRFDLDDNNNQWSDQLCFYSGDAGDYLSRPTIRILYYVP
jgi:CSLREA domain-containing protein